MKYFIRNNIRKLRFEANEMTQEELANKAEVSRQTIVAIEKAKYSPSLELAFKIASVLGLPICEVFSYGLSDSFENVHKKRGGCDEKTKSQG